MRCWVLGFLLIFLISTHQKASEKPSYRGLMRIPVQLYTSQGTVLDIGEYELEAKPVNNDDYLLTFSLAGKAKAIVKSLTDPKPDLVSAHIPLVGTHYMRSSAEPLLTGEVRRFSKTGAAQYEEEDRDWKATIRVYKSSADKAAYFLLQIKGEHGRWNRIIFRLALEKK
jgi:hypothetical protein